MPGTLGDSLGQEYGGVKDALPSTLPEAGDTFRDSSVCV